MHIILAIIVFLIFLGCAPKLFKWLLLIDVAALALYYIGLRICAPVSYTHLTLPTNREV